MKRVLPLVCATIALSVFGAGCFKSPAPAKPKTPIKPYVIPGENNNPIPLGDAHQEIRASLDAFKQLKSFRANIFIPTDGGPLTGKLEFAKPNRFHALLTSSKSGDTDIIIVGDSLYMKLKDSEWMDFSKQSGSKKIGATLQSTLNGDANFDKLGLDPSVAVTKVPDGVNSCDLYKTTLADKDGKPNNVSYCVANGLPKYVIISAKQGDIKIDYYDYNAVFLIEKPV